MTHEMITADEKEDMKLTAILHREKELFEYQSNIDSYAEQLKTLPAGDWPENLVQYKKHGHDSQKIAEHVPVELVPIVSDYAFRDYALFVKTGNELEQKRSKLIYEGIIAAVKNDGSLDDAGLNTKLAAKKVVLDAEEAARKAKELA